MADHFNLNVGDIRKSIYRQAQIGIQSEGNYQQRQENDHPLLP